MRDQAIQIPLTGHAACPGCDQAMTFICETLVAGHGGVVDRFECASCAITRLRPRRKIGCSYFDMLSAPTAPRTHRAAVIRLPAQAAFQPVQH
jgi:hypothetical protein